MADDDDDDWDDDEDEDDEPEYQPPRLEVTGPDGRVYFVVAARRGKPLNPGEFSFTDLWGLLLDVVFWVARSIFSSMLKGWKVGVVSPRSPLVGGGVKYKERVELEEQVEPRMREVADLVALRGPKVD